MTPHQYALHQNTLVDEMTKWRRDLHAHPEFGFEERRTAAFVAAKLREFGLDEVVEGVGGTGVVGTLRKGSGNRAIALRADMDALRINEEGGAPYRSAAPGTMHACGHDGHTAMLLGAAKLLVAEGGFDGTVRFVFQPAEEWGKGALAMMEDGLLKRFPFDEIYGLHNMPGLPIGHFQTRQGGLMSAEDNFEIVLKGVGGHAARPHWGREVLVAACALVMDARILGDVRSFSPQVSGTIETEMRRIADGLALVYACKASVSYTREFVPLLNDPSLTNEAMTAAATVFPPGAVGTAAEPMTASEDFARFLEHVPGCFAFVGNGEGSKPLHNPFYDFADAALIHGARFHGAIVRRRLPIV